MISDELRRFLLWNDKVGSCPSKRKQALVDTYDKNVGNYRALRNDALEKARQELDDLQLQLKTARDIAENARDNFSESSTEEMRSAWKQTLQEAQNKVDMLEEQIAYKSGRLGQLENNDEAGRLQGRQYEKRDPLEPFRNDPAFKRAAETIGDSGSFYHDSRQRGVPQGNALAGGFGSTAIAALIQAPPGMIQGNASPLQDSGSTLWSKASAGITEALGQETIDRMTAGVNSRYEKRVQEYRDQGVPEERATERAKLEIWNELF